MIIAVDVDDVLTDFFDQLIIFHNETYNTSLKIEDFQSYDTWKTWGGTRDEAISKIKKFFTSEYFDRIKPIKGSLQAIRSLEDRHKLIIVTSRLDMVAEKTMAWLRRHYQDSFKEVHFSYYDKNISKSQLCKKLGVQVIIDDAEINIIECAKAGMKVLAYDRPWNSNIKSSDNIIRVHNWDEIIVEISKLEKKSTK